MTAIGPLFSQLDSTSRPGEASNTNIAEDFNRFLNLLTVQLQNQDPLEPMDSNQFTQQIVQMTQVEQTVSMNQRLGSLIDAQETQRIQSAIEFVGKEIDALGAEFPLGANGVDLFYDLPVKADSVRVDIIDSTIANPTQSLIISLTAAPNETGTNRLFWDGNDKDGNPVDPEGKYKIRVSALDINGNEIEAQAGFTGVAEELRNTEGELTLMIAGKAVPLETIVAARNQQQQIIVQAQ